MKKNTKKTMSDDKKRLITVIALIASMFIITLIVMLAAGTFSGKDKGTDNNDTTNVGTTSPGTENSETVPSKPNNGYTPSGNPIEGPLVDEEADSIEPVN